MGVCQHGCRRILRLAASRLTPHLIDLQLIVIPPLVDLSMAFRYLSAACGRIG